MLKGQSQVSHNANSTMPMLSDEADKENMILGLSIAAGVSLLAVILIALWCFNKRKASSRALVQQSEDILPTSSDSRDGRRALPARTAELSLPFVGTGGDKGLYVEDNRSCTSADSGWEMLNTTGYSI